ncbi:MAG: hypothetical protein KDA87_10830 [Planctomycetales bacterium]|nr:hypothetical protein [Planctomycetales bacterium]
MNHNQTPFAYHGSYLEIDASLGTSRSIPLEAEFLRSCLGGSGLGTAVLLQKEAAAIDPLEPDAPICFAFSPLVGSPLTTSAKFAVVCKSPLTNRINDSLASSQFAITGKKTGFDALVIVGRAQELSVLVIDDGQIEFVPVPHLRRVGIGATNHWLKTHFAADYCFAVIGPAGERLVRFATISHDGRHAGRGGAGAVLGSKNIKAIAVRGTKRVAWADPPRLNQLAKDLSAKSFGPATQKYRELGTVSNLLTFNRLNALPTRNFQSGSFELSHELSPSDANVALHKTRASCAACTIGCEHIFSKDPQKPGVRLEYESLFALGSLCGIGSIDAVMNLTRTCDEFGIDSISAGGTIACAMECAERGLIDAPWLRFGSESAATRCLDAMNRRDDDLGNMLAKGSRQFAREVGGAAADFANHVKGLELPGYEPRALQTMALGLAVGCRGADHNRSGAYEADFSAQVDRKNPGIQAARFAVETENRAAIMDSLILCKFVRGVFQSFYDECAQMMQAATGWSIDAFELQELAFRIVDMKKEFNVRAGWTPAEDWLPPRFFFEPLDDRDGTKIMGSRLQFQIEEYNRCRGWNIMGFPQNMENGQ